MASSSVKLIGAAFLREGPLPSSLVKERLFALVAGATAIIEAATRDPSNRGAHLPEARKRRNGRHRRSRVRASQLAISADLLDAGWEPISQRIKGVIFGTGMVIWGNYLPKGLSPWRVEDEPFNWQRVHRFTGWVASLGGIAVVIVWLVFPLENARLASVGLVGTCVALVLGRKLLSLAAYSRRPPVVP